MHDTKETLKILQKSDYYKNANLHIHTVYSDGQMDCEDVIKQAKDIGLKYISITDHNTMEAYKNIDPESFFDIQLITGVEFDCWDGLNLLHIIGYGVDVNNKELLKICSKDKIGTDFDLVRFFNSRKAKDVISRIIDAGGVPVLAHPACCWSVNIKSLIKKLIAYGLEGIEVYYPYKRHRSWIKFHTAEKIEKIAGELNLLITGGTDCHDKKL
jgi:predicted metal-dependent phosphoesterase TrpH